MNTLDLENLETLLAAATPGPWEESKNDPNGIGNASGGDVASNYANSQGGICYQEDRALIVALRNAAPALIARVKELENPQIAAVVDPDTGFTINGPEWLQLPLKARLIIQELSLQNDALKDALSHMAHQHHCGCKHPACRRCQDDEVNFTLINQPQPEKS